MQEGSLLYSSWLYFSPCNTANNSNKELHCIMGCWKFGTTSIFSRLDMTVNAWMVANSHLPLDYLQLSLKLQVASLWTRLIIGIWMQSIWTSRLATTSPSGDIVMPLSLWIVQQGTTGLLVWTLFPLVVFLQQFIFFVLQLVLLPVVFTLIAILSFLALPSLNIWSTMALRS